MTEIVERMKATACPDNTGCMSIRMCVCDVVGDAVDEIERLRLTVMNLCVANGKHEDEIERLNTAIKWEQARSERVGTHGPGCWAWGHQHYECAMRLIAEMGVDARSDPLIPAGRTMLKVEEASRFLGISKSTFYRWVEKGSAPKPVYISERCPRWRLTDIQALREGLWR